MIECYSDIVNQEEEYQKNKMTPQQEWDFMHWISRNAYLQGWKQAGKFAAIIRMYSGKIYGDGGELVFPDKN